MALAIKAADGSDFKKCFSLITDAVNINNQACQEKAYETINQVFAKHHSYLCIKKFVHVEIEISKGNYQKALDFLDSAEMIPPCHIHYKEEILELIRKAQQGSVEKVDTEANVTNSINKLKVFSIEKIMESISSF